MREWRDSRRAVAGKFLGPAGRTFLVLAPLTLALAGCEKPPEPKAEPPPILADQNTTENLAGIFQDLHRSQMFGELERARAITSRLLPDERRVRLGLAPDVAADVVRRIVAKNAADVPTDDTRLANYLSGGPEASQVTITSATTEELAKESTAAAAEFPHAARRLAREGVLRPGMTYHLVRLFKPGELIGVPLHLVFWDGKNWTILGPVWRALKDASTEPGDPAPPR